MINALPIIDCNKCGECCRHGGDCILRGPSWTRWLLQPIPTKFEGACELLTEKGECAVMLRVIAQGTPEYLSKYVGVTGVCNYPELRKDMP